MTRALYALAAGVVACSTATPVPASAPPIFVPPSKLIDLTLDGARFQLVACTDGASHGFHGAELTGADGTRVRLVSEVDGAAKVIVFPPGAERGVVLEGCSRIEMVQSVSRRSSHVHGRASVLCDDKGTRIEGTVLIDSCAGS
jgi:hypothetical protein